MTKTTNLVTRLEECAAQRKRLHQALEDVSAAQPLWNGGIAKHSADYLYGFIEDLRNIAREALQHGQ